MSERCALCDSYPCICQTSTRSWLPDRTYTQQELNDTIATATEKAVRACAALPKYPFHTWNDQQLVGVNDILALATLEVQARWDRELADATTTLRYRANDFEGKFKNEVLLRQMDNENRDQQIVALRAAAKEAVEVGWADYVHNSHCHELSCGCAVIHIQDAIEAALRATDPKLATPGGKT